MDPPEVATAETETPAMAASPDEPSVTNDSTTAPVNKEESPVGTDSCPAASAAITTKEAATVETATPTMAAPPDAASITNDSTTVPVNKEEATSVAPIQKVSQVGTDICFAADVAVTTTSSTQEEISADVPPSEEKEPEILADNESKQVSQEKIPLPPPIKDPYAGTKSSSVDDPVVESTGGGTSGNETEEVASVALSNNVKDNNLSDTESDEESRKGITDSKNHVNMDACIENEQGTNDASQLQTPENITKEVLSDEQKIENGAVSVNRQAKIVAEQPPIKDLQPILPRVESKERQQDIPTALNLQKVGADSSNEFKLPGVPKTKKAKHKREWKPKVGAPRTGAPPVQNKFLSPQNNKVTSAQAAMASISQMASKMNPKRELQAMRDMIRSRKEEEMLMRKIAKQNGKQNAKQSAKQSAKQKETDGKPKKGRGRPRKSGILPADYMKSLQTNIPASSSVAPTPRNAIEYDQERNIEPASSAIAAIAYAEKRNSIYDDSQYSRYHEEVRKRQKMLDGYHHIARLDAPSPAQEAAPPPTQGAAIFTTIQENLNELLAHPHLLQAVGMNPWQLKIAAGLLAGGVPYATAAAEAANNAKVTVAQQAATSAYYAVPQPPAQQVVAQHVDPRNVTHQKLAHTNGSAGYFNDANGMAYQGPTGSSFGTQNGMWGGYPGQRPEFETNPTMRGRPDPDFSHIRNNLNQQPQRHGRQADPPADPPDDDDYEVYE